MNADEPPDETGESEGADTPTDGERDDSGPGDDGPESPDSEAMDGEGEEVVDPAEEVEAAVEDVMGSVGLDDEDRDTTADEIDESAAAAAAQELADSVASEDSAAGESTDRTADAAEADGPAADADSEHPDAADADDSDPSQDGEAVTEPAEDVPADVRKYDRFTKIDGGTYDRANEFLRDRTYITAREWAMARLCADFRTETGVEMTKIGNNLPELVPFMTDTYTPQAVNQARASFEEKVRKAGATFLYGAMCDFFTAEELDDVMYEATEVAKFLLEVEGVELSVDEELAAEDHIAEVMRDVREHSAALRHDEVTCPECGHEIGGEE